MARWISFVFLIACGAPAESSGPAVTGPTGQGPVTEPTGGGSARPGEQCDFGGADRYTCSAGLICCYPPEGEVAYGTCTAECEGYD
jgi:hypothetical protein